MKRVGADRDLEAQLAYHDAATYAADFTVEHPQRIALAHKALDAIIAVESRPLVIWELGCGAADISGPYAKDHEVVGVDSTETAEAAATLRWPQMGFLLQPLESVAPQACDIVILAEVLEHLVDPISAVTWWLAKARWSIIGHPLDEPDPPYEPGHIWSFSEDDWATWFKMGEHERLGETVYPLGNWPRAIIGTGRHR